MLQPGMSVSFVARTHGLSPSLLFKSLAERSSAAVAEMLGTRYHFPCDLQRRIDRAYQPVLAAAALVLAPLGAQAADLVLWWEYGYSPEEDAAVRETIAAFEQETGKQVEVTRLPLSELPPKIETALEAGQPPDFAFGTGMSMYHSELAIEDRLVDLTDTVGHYADLFDPDALAWWTSSFCSVS
jgi:maltose-binding protein MalE